MNLLKNQSNNTIISPQVNVPMHSAFTKAHSNLDTLAKKTTEEAKKQANALPNVTQAGGGCGSCGSHSKMTGGGCGGKHKKGGKRKSHKKRHSRKGKKSSHKKRKTHKKRHSRKTKKSHKKKSKSHKKKSHRSRRRR